MYAGYGSASPPLTNNPFLPNGIQQVASRFPDISSPSLNNGNGYNGQPQQSWGDGYMTGGGGGYSQQQQQGIYQQYPQQQMQQQPMQTGYGQQGMGGGFFSGGQNYPPQSPPPTGQFQPSTAFGQQLAANISGSSYGYLNGQQQQQQGSAYHPAQQQLQNNPNYVAQLDPYASLAQIVEVGGSSNANSYNQPSNYGNSNNGMAQSLSTGSTMSSTSSFSSSSSGASFGVGPAGDAHPKDFIRTHKAELEKWDNYAWRQLLNSFEAMKRAWEGRKTELTSKAKEIISKGQMGMAYGYYAQQIQQEASTIQEVSLISSLPFLHLYPS